MRISFFPPTPEQFKSLFELTPPPRNQKKISVGGGLSDISIFTPAYTGGRRRGGGIFSNITKRILPFLFKSLKPTVQNLGKNLYEDVIVNKKNIRQSLKNRGKESLRDAGQRLISSVTQGGGKKKRKRSSSRPPPHSSKKRRRRTRTKSIKDIYSLIE